MPLSNSSLAAFLPLYGQLLVEAKPPPEVAAVAVAGVA
jgi:hypothetical protein